MQSVIFGVVAVLSLSEAGAPSFRNQGIQLPNAGWLGTASASSMIAGGGWNTWDHPTIGTGYFHAIGYQTWVEVQAAFGMSAPVLHQSTGFPPVFTLLLSSGLRYNLLEEDLRPYVAAHFDVLYLTSPDAALVPANTILGQPIFAGLRPSVGVEWIAFDEVSLQADLGAGAFFVPDSARSPVFILPAAVGRLSVNVYF